MIQGSIGEFHAALTLDKSPELTPLIVTTPQLQQRTMHATCWLRLSAHQMLSTKSAMPLTSTERG